MIDVLFFSFPVTIEEEIKFHNLTAEIEDYILLPVISSNPQ